MNTDDVLRRSCGSRLDYCPASSGTAVGPPLYLNSTLRRRFAATIALTVSRPSESVQSLLLDS
ncbi:hypothetical protein [Nocardia brasiliensis]|uniref:hypothetical protein n=1 Tax=Nocardia brasiliensis TaxID=37326 RepID=UPI0024537E31|nr:hypothetical protein [Nocardia brasiliensis]